MIGEEDRRKLDRTCLKARLMSAAMIVAPAVYVVMGVIMRNAGRSGDLPQMEAREREILLVAFMAVGLLLCVIAAMLRAKFLSPDYVRRRVTDLAHLEKHFMTWTTLSTSMAETVAVLGLVYFLLTWEFDKLIIMAGLGVVFGVAFFPSRSRLDALADALGTKGDDAWGSSPPF